jgi:hypothetical protein
MEYARAFIVSTVIHHRCYQYWQTELCKKFEFMMIGLHSKFSLWLCSSISSVCSILLDVLFFCFCFSFGHSIISVSIYGFSWPDLYLQSFLWHRRFYVFGVWYGQNCLFKNSWPSTYDTHRRDRGTQPQWKLWVKSDHHEFKLFAYYDKNTRRITVKWLKHILT